MTGHRSPPTHDGPVNRPANAPGRDEESLLARLVRAWRAAGRDILLIVASILIAFALDAWWQGQREDAREELLLRDLRDEFRENRTELARIGGWHRIVESAATQLLDLGNGTPLPPGVDADSVVAEVFLTGASFNPATGALSAWLASEEGGTVSNSAIRARLGGWQGLLQDVAEDEERIFRFVDHEAMPYLAARASFVAALGAAPALRGDYPEPLHATPVEELSRELEFRNFTARRLAMERWALVEYARLDAEMTEVMELLDSELER